MFPILAGSNPSGYNFTRSLRVRASATAYLSRTPATASNQKTMTFSAWVKIGTLGAQYSTFWSAGSASPNPRTEYGFSYDTLYLGLNPSGSTWHYIQTNAVFRDPSAWYHIVFAIDTTQATSTNRVKVYINGVQVTAFASYDVPSQNTDLPFNNTVAQYLGRYAASTSQQFDGYLAEVNFIDGQALTPSSFGSTNTLTGVWQPAPYTGSYGTNGFILDFEDNSALTTSSNVGLGKDTSGNGNYWTTNNISITSGVTYDSMTDVPTLTSATAANFAVLNPLAVGANSSQITFSNGNLRTSWSSTGTYAVALATIGISSGKWYWEVINTSADNSMIGVLKDGDSLTNYVGQTANGYSWYSSGSKYNNGSGSAYASAYAQNDVVGVALDMNAGTLTFYKNGTSQGQAFSGLSGLYFPAVSDGDSAAAVAFAINFGQRPFAYTPPTGFVALNTFNLPTSTIIKGNTVMDATLYTGNGSTLAVSNAGGFQPDFVWVKNRGAATSHVLQDSVRGAGKSLFSNATNAESGNAGDLITSFNSNGFTVNDTYLGGSGGGGTNGASGTYVGWQWQAGQGTTSTNTSGSITSTVSVNASAGFSVVTYTAQSSGTGTVGHGLGVAPSLIITKPRANPYGWTSYHASLGNTQYIELNTTSAAATNSTVWNNTSPTSSVFTLGSAFAGNGTYVAYCWTPIAGYSAFGSYTGNGSTDGPFIYTGFRPKFVMFKVSSTTSNWFIRDTVRDPYNASTTSLYPNLSDAEFASAASLDILSNGFKPRASTSGINGSGENVIYMAFAENPTKYALAR